MLIAASKEQAAEEDQEERSEQTLTVYSDGLRVDGGVGAAAVLYKGSMRVAHARYHLGKEDKHTVFEAEGIGVTLGAQMVIKYGKGSKDMVFALDNQAVIQALGSTRIQPGAYILEVWKLLQRIDKRQQRGKRLHIRWVPGHVGVEGNKAADVEAKEAAAGRTSDKTRLPRYLWNGPLPQSLLSVVELFTKRLKATWQERWKRGARIMKMNKIDKNMPSWTYLDLIDSLPRRQSSIIVQLCTGFAPLNSFLHCIKARDSPDCPHCLGQWEMTFHLLVKCLNYAKYQHDILTKKHRQWAEKISYLLSDPTCVQDTVKFIATTTRFNKPIC
jgi:ribonuclease HI